MSDSEFYIMKKKYTDKKGDTKIYESKMLKTEFKKRYGDKSYRKKYYKYKKKPKKYKSRLIKKIRCLSDDKCKELFDLISNEYENNKSQ
jgi:hypothetical protein